MKLFNLDGPFHIYGTLVFDIVLLNLLWLFMTVFGFGIPFGIATTALYYSMDKSIINGRGYVLKNFWKSIKVNFIQATIVWIIMVVAFAVVGINIYYLNNVDMGTLGNVLLIANYFIFFELTLISMYIFPLLAKLNITTKNLFINSFILAHKHVFTTLLCVIIAALPIVMMIYVSAVVVFFGFSVSAYFISKLIVGRVLKKYFNEEELTKFELD